MQRLSRHRHAEEDCATSRVTRVILWGENYQHKKISVAQSYTILARGYSLRGELPLLQNVTVTDSYNESCRSPLQIWLQWWTAKRDDGRGGLLFLADSLVDSDCLTSSQLELVCMAQASQRGHVLTNSVFLFQFFN